MPANINPSYSKEPEEQETVKIAWTKRIESLAVSGYAISSVVVSITDAQKQNMNDTMLVGVPTTSGGFVLVTIKGGVSGKSYNCRAVVILSKPGFVDQVQTGNLKITVQEESALT